MNNLADAIITAMVLAHDEGCRRALLVLSPKVSIEKSIEVCGRLSDIYRKDLTRESR